MNDPDIHLKKCPFPLLSHSGLDLLSTLSRIRRSLDAASPSSSSSSSTGSSSTTPSAGGVASTETGVQLQLQLDVFDEQKIHDEDEFPELAANFNTPIDVFNNVFNKVRDADGGCGCGFGSGCVGV